MKKNIFITLFAILLISCQNQAQNKVQAMTESTEQTSKPTIYNFIVDDINGNKFDFSKYQGYKIMIVNTASKCGLTPQYKELEELYQKHKEQKFIIVGFPANNFAEQEPGTNKEIATFCSKDYGVTFPMMAKVSVKGKDINKVYQFLTEKGRNGLKDNEVEWNFQKYLINRNGELEKIISPQTTPLSDDIVNWIQK